MWFLLIGVEELCNITEVVFSCRKSENKRFISEMQIGVLQSYVGNIE